MAVISASGNFFSKIPEFAPKRKAVPASWKETHHLMRRVIQFGSPSCRAGVPKQLVVRRHFGNNMSMEDLSEAEPIDPALLAEALAAFEQLPVKPSRWLEIVAGAPATSEELAQIRARPILARRAARLMRQLGDPRAIDFISPIPDQPKNN